MSDICPYIWTNKVKVLHYAYLKNIIKTNNKKGVGMNKEKIIKKITLMLNGMNEKTLEQVFKIVHFYFIKEDH
jgi:hypothetical protein